MSSAGSPTRETARTVIALLVVAGLVLVAVVLPAIGQEAPGRSLLPDRTTGDASEDAVERALQGENGRSGGGGSGPGDSLVGGAMGDLPREGTDALGERGVGDGQPGAGEGGRSGFGALDPGDSTGVGSSESLTSESLRNRSSQPHFLVESPRPAYWRTGAYDTYTGDGWENSETGRQDLPLVDTVGPNRESLVQEVTLRQSATALPGAWQPVDVRGLSGVSATPQRALRADERVPAGTTYRVVSSVPTDDPERLRNVGRDYPAAIRERYTQLPAETPDRLREFTTELTADADSPYEKAVRIERWLESEKSYSLSATHEGGSVADQFVFEMERGYCEYFATAMVAMLRSEGIPARYVVGYSTGQAVGDDEYVVRAMNAHAWVEVYVPERGWVRFDPTPARSRLANEARAAQAATDADADGAADSFTDRARDPGGDRSGVPELPEEAGRDGSGDLNRSDLTENESVRNDTDAPNGSQPPDVDGTATAPNGTDGAVAEITLLSDPVPGRPVTVEVTRSGQPLAGVPVSFNGERVGRTNESGLVSAPVPFAPELVVGVAENATVRRTDGDAAGGGDSTGSGAGSAAVGLGGGAVAGASDGRLRSVSVPSAASTQDGDDTVGNETTERFDVPTNVTITVAGDPEPGETVTVETLLANRSLAGATVAVDGERVGETAADGTVEATLPAAESVTITATRGAANGTRTLPLANVSVSTAGFALPGLSVTVSVTDGGDPVEGATVAVGGRTVETGPDGEATVPLPVATGATVTVTTPAGITKTASVPYQFLTAGALLALALGLVAALLYLHRRATAAGHSLTEHLSTLAAWLPGAAVGALVALAARGERLLGRLPAALRAVVTELRAAIRAAIAAVRERGLDRDALPGPRALAGLLLARLRAALARLRAALRGARTAVVSRGTDDAPATGSEVADPPPVQHGPTARERIEAAWADFRERVPAADRESMTPGELSREAVAAGFPDSPVRTLTDAFRAVEYGRRDPHGYVEPAERARDRLADGDELDDETATDGGTADDVTAAESTADDGADGDDGGAGQ
jgi:transglutaminase-like putative cysteine protease